MSNSALHLGPEPPVAARLVSEHVCAFDVVLEAERRTAFEAGQRAALAAAALPLDQAVASVSAIAEQAQARLARSAAELALAIARALLQREVADGRYDLEQLVRLTLADSDVDRGACTVHLHPDDHARLADVTFRSGTRLQPDVGVPLGEVQVETALGLIVRSVDEGLEAIGDRILARLP